MRWIIILTPWMGHVDRGHDEAIAQGQLVSRFDSALWGAEIPKFKRLRCALDAVGRRLRPPDRAGKRSILTNAVLVDDRHEDAITLFEAGAPPGFKIMIATTSAAKGFLKRLRSKGVHVVILKAEVAGIPRRAELDTNEMTCVFTCAVRDGALGRDAAMGNHLPRHTQLAGGLLIGI